MQISKVLEHKVSYLITNSTTAVASRAGFP